MTVPVLADVQAAVKAAHDHAVATGAIDAVSRLNHLAYLLSDRTVTKHFGAADAKVVPASAAG
jgi:hypothetical protein